jgi:uncharacterized protein YjbJ (UPF0337 family)
MNKDRIKGKIEEIKGDVKQRIGGARKDRPSEAEGWLEEKKGQIRGGVGEVKDEMKRERRDPDRDRDF